MKNILLFIALSVYISGCASIPGKILPPIYEERYPFIAGIANPTNEKDSTVTSVLVDIIGKSELVSGLLNAPCDNTQVDFLLRVDRFNVEIRKSGLFSLRWKMQGSLLISLLDRDLKTLESYEENATSDEKSYNLFSHAPGLSLLTTSLITRILDRVSQDLESGIVKSKHLLKMEDKVSFSSVSLKYPDISHFRRRNVLITTKLMGTQPPMNVRFQLNRKDGSEVFSQKLYFEHLRNVNREKEWSFFNEVSISELPFNSRFNYRLVSNDIECKEVEFENGMVETIPGELFRLKQAEVIAQGTIITVFAGLFVVMMLYSI